MLFYKIPHFGTRIPNHPNADANIWNLHADSTLRKVCRRRLSPPDGLPAGVIASTVRVAVAGNDMTGSIL